MEKIVSSTNGDKSSEHLHAKNKQTNKSRQSLHPSQKLILNKS